MNYLSVGHLIIDEIISETGQKSEHLIGGPALFGLAGIKIWTDECGILSHVGEDFNRYFGKWFADNHISTLLVDVIANCCNRHRLTYRPDNTYHCDVVTGYELRGYLRPRPSDLAQLPSNVTGIYLTLGWDVRMWEQILREKRRLGFSIMWELETLDNRPEARDNIKSIAQQLEMFSVNIQEASRFLQIPESEEYTILKTLAEWDVPFIFFRVGKRGSYAIFDRKWVFLPSVDADTSVDSTGCGNCSTAAAGYGFCRTGDPVTAAIMGNISAAFNARYTGMIPLIDEEMRREAKEMLADYFIRHKVQPGYELSPKNL